MSDATKVAANDATKVAANDATKVAAMAAAPGDRRIARHPVLGDDPGGREVTIYLDGEPVAAREGEPVMAALVAAGVGVFRRTKRGSPRRMFCGIGRCTDCVMIVDGIPGVRTCVTQVREGMRVERQEGAGSWRGGDGHAN